MHAAKMLKTTDLYRSSNLNKLEVQNIWTNHCWVPNSNTAHGSVWIDVLWKLNSRLLYVPSSNFMKIHLKLFQVILLVDRQRKQKLNESCDKRLILQQFESANMLFSSRR